MKEGGPQSPKETNMPVYNKRKKVAMARALASYFRLKGKILTEEEYNAATDQPARAIVVRKMFRGYEVALKMVTQVDRTIEADLAPKPQAAPQPKPKAKVKKDDE